VLSISSANDVTHQLIKLDHASASDLRAALHTMSVDDAALPGRI